MSTLSGVAALCGGVVADAEMQAPYIKFAIPLNPLDGPLAGDLMNGFCSCQKPVCGIHRCAKVIQSGAFGHCADLLLYRLWRAVLGRRSRYEGGRIIGYGK